ncbi:MAG: hypothetical protein NTV39_00440 [Candidatus Saccharibacteria bacterium]|nr:hypothetical protein [Candidatus Saccharibacteria bacterium]
MPPRSEKENNSFEKAFDFKSEVDSIVNRPLVPDTIDSYADYALNDLINVVERVTKSYNYQPTIGFISDRNTETAAFNYFGLGDIGLMLDNIADRADELKDIDGVIENLEPTERVITPADSSMGGLAVRQCDGSFERNRSVPKLKTFLFVLHNDFDVDIHDDEQVKIISGSIESRSIQKRCYYSVEVPTLERSALVCDEAGNTTFVFDSGVLKKHGVENGDLIKLNKKEIEELIDKDPKVGRKVYYSKNFVSRIVGALENPATVKNETFDEKSDETAGRYLLPKAPEGILPVNGMVRLWGVGGTSISQIIDDNQELIGQTADYRFGAHKSAGYLPEQQDVILRLINERGLLRLASEDILSVSAMRDEWGVSYGIIKRTIAENREQIGIVNKYKFHTKMAPGYTPEQQVIIKKSLEEKGLLDNDPKDRVSIPVMSELWDLDPKTIRKVISANNGLVGEVKEYKFHTQTAPGYTSEQQEIIRQLLEEKGYFSDEAPEGFLTVYSMAQAWGETHAVVSKAVAHVKDELGDTPKYKFGKFGGRIVPGYSPEQQVIIKRYIDEKRQKKTSK